MISRRQFLIKSSLAVTGVSLFTIGTWHLIPSSEFRLTTQAIRQTISHIKPYRIRSTGAWSPFVIFSHIAQSIELSITGYPQHKSDWFKSTLGKTALSLFLAKKQMKHGLDEPIPGAALIQDQADTYLAIQRLERALDRFEQFEGQLQPHFAYGHLTRSEYTAAHAMHFYNHLNELELDAFTTTPTS